MNTPNTSNFRKVLWQVPAVVLVAGAIGLVANFLRPDGISLIGEWSVEAQFVTYLKESIDISLEEALEACVKNEAVFMDARSAEAYKQGRIKCAVSLPWHKVVEQITEVLDTIPPERMIITYCDGETCNLSKDLALYLIDMGYANVRVLVNGWTLWRENRLPVEM